MAKTEPVLGRSGHNVGHKLLVPHCRKNTWCDHSFVCNNDLPQSNHDFCTKAAWPRPSQFWSIVTTMWGTNCECSIAAKTHGEAPVLCVIMIYHSPIMSSAQRLHGQDRASFGAQWPQCGHKWGVQHCRKKHMVRPQFCVQ